MFFKHLDLLHIDSWITQSIWWTKMQHLLDISNTIFLQMNWTVVQQHVDDMLAKGWIRPSVSPYGAPILFVCKMTSELCMCVDFHSLNKQMRLDMFPIPHIHDLLNKLGKARIFSAVDLSSAYHQVHIKEGHEHKTAFLTPMGLFEYVVMPLGLTNAPATF